MKRSDGQRARLGALVLAVALAATAMLVLPGLGMGHPRSSDEAAGTVQSFDSNTGQLVIDLAKGDTISALVTPRTHVRCGDEGRRRHGNPNHLRGGEPGSDSSERNDGPPPRGEGAQREPGDDSPGNDPRNDDQPGEDHHGFGEDHSKRCKGQLVPGATVLGAQIVLIDGNAFYKDVGLMPQPPTPKDDDTQ